MRAMMFVCAKIFTSEGGKAMRAWLFQDPRQKKKLGDKAPWSVGWIDPDSNRKSKRIGSKSAAGKFRRKTEGELAAGTYQLHSRKTWDDFRAEYEQKILPRMASRSQITIRSGLDHFERIVKPGQVSRIKTATIDGYVESRRTERGAKKGSTVSPFTVNRELRHLKAALNVAKDWGYLATVPKIKLLKEPVKIPSYVTPEHFAAIYKACEGAARPNIGNVEAADWWRALLVTAYMTGWRIRELLALRRDNVDLANGVAELAAEDTKANRAERLPLHSTVVEHLEKVPGFSVEMFPLECDERMLWTEFARIQERAGIHLPCSESHEHTPACHVYGFHDLRRAFATNNAERLTGDALQRLMRHKDYSTTQRYINMAGQLNRSVDNLHVPDVLRHVGG